MFQYEIRSLLVNNGQLCQRCFCGWCWTLQCWLLHFVSFIYIRIHSSIDHPGIFQGRGGYQYLAMLLNSCAKMKVSKRFEYIFSWYIWTNIQIFIRLIDKNIFFCALKILKNKNVYLELNMTTVDINQKVLRDVTFKIDYSHTTFNLPFFFC